MAERKTIPTGASVDELLASLDDPTKRADAEALVALMRDVTGEAPAMWGGNIIGFGSSHYRYASGREGDTFIIGFSPRKPSLVLYLGLGDDVHDLHDLLGQLGPHTMGKGC